MLQVALSVVALVGASLFVRSLRNAGRIDPGFDADHVGIVVFNVAEHGYDEARGAISSGAPWSGPPPCRGWSRPACR